MCPTILCTGGLGYIGLHTCVELFKAKYEIVIVDNLSNSSRINLTNLESLLKRKVPFYNIDLKNREGLDRVFRENKIYGVIHFAAFKSVPESTHCPLDYYENNVNSLLVLLKAMFDAEVFKIVFSSSAAVYYPTNNLMSEHSYIKPLSPYGRTKWTSEMMLEDLVKSDSRFSAISLRYFNPIGSDKSKIFGNFSNQENLLPSIIRETLIRRNVFEINGGYDTEDSTGHRDYVHVEDIAIGHVTALDYIGERAKGFYDVFNLGTGASISTLKLFKAVSIIHFAKKNGIEQIKSLKDSNGFEKDELFAQILALPELQSVTSKFDSELEYLDDLYLPYTIGSMRQGDAKTVIANPSKAKRVLAWEAKRTVPEAIYSQLIGY